MQNKYVNKSAWYKLSQLGFHTYVCNDGSHEGCCHLEPQRLFGTACTIDQEGVDVVIAGQGFGINPAIYDNRDGFANALGGLQTLVSNRAVRAATIITPHVYGGQVTGKALQYPFRGKSFILKSSAACFSRKDCLLPTLSNEANSSGLPIAIQWADDMSDPVEWQFRMDRSQWRRQY